jgi:RNA polymerase sigma-70 factor (ECF subfamily)
MTDEEHRALVRTIAARNEGSEAAMAGLYRALHGQVFAFVRRRWGMADDHEVQAVVGDTLYEVWRAAGRFTGESQVRTWVLGIARHKMLDALRQGKAGLAHDDIEEHATTLADPSADLLQGLVERQKMDGLATCMDRLPTEQRESLHLLLVEALAVEEIARIQGCPSGTVKSRVFHAKQKLKDCLARWFSHEAGASAAHAAKVNAE